jgi:hypothetical protein
MRVTLPDPSTIPPRPRETRHLTFAIVANGIHRTAGRRYDLGVSDISDPGRAGRRDRKRAQKLIDAAYAAGQLTAADRAFRIQRVDSAHTKGDLAVLVRDLKRAAGAAPAATAAAPATPPTDPTAGPAATSLGSAIPPDQLSAMVRGKVGSAATINMSKSMRSVLSADGVRTARRVVLITVVGFLLLCGLGVGGIVYALFTGIDQGDGPSSTTAPTSSVNLQTAKGWTQLVAAIDKETGTSRVYDAVVYPEYASINAVVDEGAMRYVYRGGGFQLFNSPVTAATHAPVDLADIDADLVEGLPDRTAKRQGMPDYDSAYFIVNRQSGEPAIMVYLQQQGKLSRWSIYDLDGKVIGGTPD